MGHNGRDGLGPQLNPDQREDVLKLFREMPELSMEDVGSIYKVSGSTIAGIIRKARIHGELPWSQEGEVRGHPGPRIQPARTKAERDNRRSLTIKEKNGSLIAPHSRPLPKPAKSKDEPAPIGPIEDFPPADCCRYMKGDPLKPGWQMCGHPGFPWCDWHKDNRINPKRDQAA